MKSMLILRNFHGNAKTKQKNIKKHKFVTLKKKKKHPTIG